LRPVGYSKGIKMSYGGAVIADTSTGERGRLRSALHARILRPILNFWGRIINGN